LGIVLLSFALASCKHNSDPKPAEETAHITSEPAQSIPGRAVQAGMGVQCKNNLQQLRMLIDTAKNEDEDGRYPASLANIPEATHIMECPISHKPYEYDPTTGQVHCTFPGHENF
jgi:hypothetical protein